MDIDDLAYRINETARAHGFWDKPRNFGEMLMLAVSELSEALEEDRDGRPSVWFKHQVPCSLSDNTVFGSENGGTCNCTPKPEGALVEIADCIIRCLDTGQDLAAKMGYTYTVGEVVELKMKYNESREHMHGKAY